MHREIDPSYGYFLVQAARERNGSPGQLNPETSSQAKTNCSLPEGSAHFAWIVSFVLDANLETRKSAENTMRRKTASTDEEKYAGQCFRH